MAETDSTRQESQRWFRWASEDLLAAERTAGDADVAPRVACGLAQQAAEKAIKALLVFSDIDPPRSHDLLRLARMLTEAHADRLVELGLEELTRWSIEGRYPADLDEATSTDATRAIDLARQVTTLVHRALAEETRGDGP